MPIDLAALGVDPEWLAQKRAELGQALESDKQAQTDEDRRALLMQFAQSYANRRPMPVEPRKAGGAMAKFGADLGLEERAQKRGLDAFEALTKIKAGKEPKPGEEPLDPAMTEAIRRAGKDPALARNRAEGFRLLGFASQEAARAAADADRDASRSLAAGTAQVTRDAAKARAEDRQRENESKQAMGPDFEPLDNTSPLYSDETSKRGLLESAQASRKLSRAVGVVRDIIKREGTNPLTLSPDARTRLDSAIADIRTQIKTIDKLGVIAGPDMPAFISPQIDNPATFSNHFLTVFKVRDPIAQLDQLEKNMAGGVAEAADGYGVKLSPKSFFGPFQRAKPVAPAPGAGTRVKVVAPDGRKGTIDASELDAAIKNGWRRADG